MPSSLRGQRNSIQHPGEEKHDDKIKIKDFFDLVMTSKLFIPYH